MVKAKPKLPGGFTSIPVARKDNLHGNISELPHSTAKPLIASRKLQTIQFTNVGHPPSVGALPTGASQTMTSATTRAQPSPASSLRTSVHTNSTRPSRFTLDSLASCTPLLRQERLAYWLALLWIIPPASADEGNAIPTPEPSLPWPFNQGPPGLWGFIFAIIIAIIIIVCIYSKRKWPQKFQDPAPGLILLVCCTFSGFCIMGDGTTSNTTLLSIGALQVYLGQSFARMRHRMPDGSWYAMSIHFWPLIFILTVVLALLCKKASRAMYNQDVQLPWFPFTIPCFGVAVAICVYLGYLWKSLDFPLLPRHNDRGRRGSA